MPTGNMSPARELAYEAFLEVMERGANPNEIIDLLVGRMSKNLGRKKVSRLDRNLAKEILYGSLRWYSKIYWILQQTSKRDLDESPAEVRTSLVCGTYQIFYLDRVPDRAAVNESVEYVRRKGHGSAVSFVNGILRQIARRAEYFAKPDKIKQPIDYLALQYAHPRWLVDRWSNLFKFDRLEKLLASNNQPPPWTARANLIKVPVEEVHLLQQELLKKERVHSDRRPLRCTFRCKEAPDLGPGSLFQAGQYTIQDESSQLIGYLVQPEANQTIAEAAAGPGGKLTHMIELCGGNAHFLAVEKNASQLRKAQATAQRLGHDDPKLVTWIEQDFLDWQTDATVDKILLDAPCSGLGVLSDATLKPSG